MLPAPEDIRPAAIATLTWLKRSMDVHGGRGSAAYYSRWRHPLRGWAPPYPETTGYLIETLLDAGRLLEAPWANDYARRCGEWLLTVQHPEGWYPALYADSGRPSAFNTGMILFGLRRLWVETREQAFFYAMERAVRWLLKAQESDGSWQAGAYVANYEPTYYTRLIWSVLATAPHLPGLPVEASMERAMDVLRPKFLPTGWLAETGFRPGEAAFTHTLAYALRGYWEISELQADEEGLDAVRNTLERLAEDWRRYGRLAGRYDVDGRGDRSFVCLTGNAQLSILYFKAYRYYREEAYSELGRWLFHSVLQFQRPSGAIAGSQPFWGPYQRLRYPNWAAKFFLDAFLEYALSTRP